MAGLIKNYSYQNISVLQDEPVMTTFTGQRVPTPVITPEPELTPAPKPKPKPEKKPDDRKLAPIPHPEPPPEPEENPYDYLPDDPHMSRDEKLLTPSGEKANENRHRELVTKEEAELEREQLTAEYEAIRAHYEQQSEEFILRARKKADEIYEQTKELAEKTILDARKEAEKIKADAAEEGKKEGYDVGVKQGYDEGYTKALKKCKDSLLELKALSEAVTEQKSEIFMRYERQLFDTIFEIAQKVTINSLNQHDKGVITKMLREAGKKYKASRHVTVMLSKLDVEQNAELDEDLIRDVFKNSENVEIEILPDAPKGTLIIDNGSEITDAGVMTQLEIIEQLGSGKFRDKSITDMIRETVGGKKPDADEAPENTEKAEAPENAENGEAAEPEAADNGNNDGVNDGINDGVNDDNDDDDVIPDVAYTDGSGNKNG